MDRLLHAEDSRLKQVTGDKFVLEELEEEMKRLTSELTEMFGRLTEFARFDLMLIKYKLQR